MNKRLSLNIIASLISFVIGMGINFFLSPYIIENIGADAYGFVGLANNFISYASLFTLALNSMAGRFITIEIHKNNKEKIQQYFNSVLVANIVMAMIIGILSLVIVVNLDSLIEIKEDLLVQVQVLFGLLFANMLLGLISTVFTASLFATNRLDLRAKRDIESNVLRALILVFLFYLFKPSVIYLGIASLVTGTYVTITNIYYTKILLPGIEINIKYFRLKIVYEIIFSGIWNVFTKLGAIMATGLDLLITNIFVDSLAMGVLSISKTFPTLVLNLFATLAGVFAPNLTISYANNDIKDMEQQLLQAMKVFVIISCVPLVVLVALGDVFYQLWVPNENYDLLYTLSILAAVELLFSVPLEPLWTIFTVTNKLKISSVVVFMGSFISITSVLILLPFINDLTTRLYIIAGVSAFVATLRNIIFLPIYGAKCLGLKWNVFYPIVFKNILTFCIITTIMLFVKTYLSVSWLSLIIMIVMITFLNIVMNFLIVLEKKDRLAILLLIKNFFKNKKEKI